MPSNRFRRARSVGPSLAHPHRLAQPAPLGALRRALARRLAVLALLGIGAQAGRAEDMPASPGQLPSAVQPVLQVLPALGEDPLPVRPASAERRFGYVIGLSLDEVPTYSGSGSYELRPRPLWALQYGNFRLSTSGARAVMGFGGEAVSGSGASLQLADTGLWKIGAALRLASGRSSSDDPALAGLPDIRATLRGRVYADRRLGEHWSVGLGVSQDLLGRAGGALASVGLGYGARLTAHTTWSAGLSANVANGTYMQTHYGVDPAASLRSGYPAFAPRAGLLDIGAGVGAMTALSPHWIFFTGAGTGRLLGDSANSPLTRSTTSWRLSAGIAYRCCKP